MRTHFPADLHTARARFAKQPYASGGSQMQAMNVMIAKFREQNIAHDNDFLTRRRPARQTEQRAPTTLIHHPAADQIVIPALIKYRHTNHAGILNRAPHQFVILDTMPVVGDRDDTCLRE